MQANEMVVTAKSDPCPAPGQIASWGHLAGFLLIMAGIASLGFVAQHSASAPAGQLAGHSHAIQIYLTALLMDWALLYYCWAGVHRWGGTLETLSGGRWKNWRDVIVDAAITLPFLIVWEGTAYAVSRLLGPGSAKSVDSLLPRTLIEVLVWIGLCLTAGICEELAFRGYLQRQFGALMGGAAPAVLGQALVFGLAHSYQGWKPVVVISVVAVLYGALAAWRKNLRANMMAHAATDLWEGWLKFLVLR
jgi:membrane protease YdiL (CAAX protease family)